MSKIRTVLFDLDGTLLPMDQKQFVHAYFHSLYAALEPFGFSKEGFQKAMWESVGAAIQNDGATTNEEAFWRAFQTLTGAEPKAVLPVIERYYRREFQEVSKSCGYTPYAKQTVERLRKIAAGGCAMIIVGDVPVGRGDVPGGPRGLPAEPGKNGFCRRTAL